MSWFSWFDKQEEQKSQVSLPSLQAVSTVRAENTSLNEPLTRVSEEGSSAASSAPNKQKGSLHSRLGETEQYDGTMMSPPSARMIVSKDSEEYTRRRDAYKVADEALSPVGSGDQGYTSPTADTEDESEGAVEEEDDIDLEVVEQYDIAFNEFIAAHPNFLFISPDVVNSLRVCKLQKLLERGSNIEAELSEQLETLQASKANMEMHYHKELREASRKKAAREVHMSAKLDATKHTTRAMEAKLMWRLVSTYEANAKKQHKLHEKLKTNTVGTDPASLLAALPSGPDFQSIRDAMLAPPSTLSPDETNGEEPLSEEQENDLRQFQMDNAFLLSEVAVLQKKLDLVKAAAKKNSWVESMLVRMDPKVLKKLKAKYQKHAGVTL